MNQKERQFIEAMLVHLTDRRLVSVHGVIDILADWCEAPPEVVSRGLIMASEQGLIETDSASPVRVTSVAITTDGKEWLDRFASDPPRAQTPARRTVARVEGSFIERSIAMRRQPRPGTAAEGAAAGSTSAPGSRSSQHGPTARQLQVLATLEESEDGMTFDSLARAIGCSVMSIRNYLEPLRAAGEVTETPVGRALWFGLSSKGRQRLQKSTTAA